MLGYSRKHQREELLGISVGFICLVGITTSIAGVHKGSSLLCHIGLGLQGSCILIALVVVINQLCKDCGVVPVLTGCGWWVGITTLTFGKLGKFRGSNLVYYIGIGIIGAIFCMIVPFLIRKRLLYRRS